MQTSGTFAGLSDGVKKTITGGIAPKGTGTVRKDETPKASTHRAGGHAKHTRRPK